MSDVDGVGVGVSEREHASGPGGAAGDLGDGGSAGSGQSHRRRGQDPEDSRLAQLTGHDAFARGMWAEGLVAALATLAVAWPLTELLREKDWLVPAVLMVVLVALVGAVLRTVDAAPSVVSLGQLLVGLVGVSQIYLRDTLRWWVVPTPVTADRVGELLREAGTVLQTYAAPAPTTTGVAFLIVSVLTLTAVSVDSMGVTGRAPASAGIPLAAGFLVSVSNSGRAMEPWYFGAVAILWLVMLAQQGHRVLAAWPSTDRREAVGGDDVARSVPNYHGLTQVLGALTLVAAVLGAAVIPHLPPTFFADGLARNTQARTVGDGGAEVSFTETMDPSQDLQNQSQAPVLTYRTDAVRLEPLRVTATERWEDGRWVAPERRRSELLPAGTPIPRPDGMGQDVPAREQRVTVTGNALEVPHLALPFPPSALQLSGGGASYRFDPTDSTVVLQEPAQGYTASYLSLAGRAELPAGVGDQPADPERFDADLLTVDPVSADEVAALTEEVVGGTSNSLEAAVRIQDHLRGSDYTYSLTLAPAAEADADDPIGGFLETRQGYCVQFATAMVMMARSEGIPARMAVGFLPGEIQTDGTRKVIASDAHTWPELWIEGLGWTRFEPTPGVRSSAPPAYARQESDASASETTTTTTTRTVAPTAEPTAPPRRRACGSSCGRCCGAPRSSSWRSACS
ncbi:transglutaminase family protein [Ornithinimicrobium avium]|uniref:Transglutaminase domain-containing protein n=1 Tax=Ornithinimicrobium avium TaxID=2283195 RepID=A0A345NKW0_9MICO|nr:DUF3488 and transglutaminase-like domain-containing protein [Ornithinimicrobium avium]AXH95668.1 transglutaminase domain-containing protein [Ornithinimicrobium avium]